MSGTVYYGRALYYPYINFSNVRWLKMAALYYDGLDRIVPPGYTKFTDGEIVKRINDKEEFIRDRHPDSNSLNDACDFLSFAKTELSDINKRKRFFLKIGAEYPDFETFTVNDLKISTHLKKELQKLQLVSTVEQEGNLTFDSVTGIMYMMFLANIMAQKESEPLVTDNPYFHPIIRSAQAINPIPQNNSKIDLGFALASIVIESVVPENLDNISFTRIMNFRNKHKNEWQAFYTKINELVTDLQNVETKEALEYSLQFKKNQIDYAVTNLKKAFKGMKITTVSGMMGLSVPAFASGIGGIVATAGIVSVATMKLIGQANDYKKSKAESPYSYVLSLQSKLKSESFAKQLLRGKIIF